MQKQSYPKKGVVSGLSPGHHLRSVDLVSYHEEERWEEGCGRKGIGSAL